VTVAENATALEALRAESVSATASPASARVQHFVSTQGNSVNIRSKTAAVRALTTDPAILAKCDEIDALTVLRDGRDTTLRDRLSAVDTAWAPIDAALTAHSCGGYGQGYGGQA
jgi:hypothetical protein